MAKKLFTNPNKKIVKNPFGAFLRNPFSHLKGGAAATLVSTIDAISQVVGIRPKQDEVEVKIETEKPQKKKRARKKKVGTFEVDGDINFREINTREEQIKVLEDVYRRNKDRIESANLTKEIFINDMLDRVNAGSTLRNALKKVSRTRDFLSEDELALENLRKNARKNKDMQKQLETLGLKIKDINGEQFYWDDELESFVHSFIDEDGNHKDVLITFDEEATKNYVAGSNFFTMQVVNYGR